MHALEVDWTRSIILNVVELFGAGLIYYLLFGVIFSNNPGPDPLSVILVWPIVYFVYSLMVGLLAQIFKDGMPLILLPVWLAIIVFAYFLMALKIAGSPLSWLLLKTFRQQFQALVTFDPFSWSWYSFVPARDDPSHRWAG